MTNARDRLNSSAAGAALGACRLLADLRAPATGAHLLWRAPWVLQRLHRWRSARGAVETTAFSLLAGRLLRHLPAGLDRALLDRMFRRTPRVWRSGPCVYVVLPSGWNPFLARWMAEGSEAPLPRGDGDGRIAAPFSLPRGIPALRRLVAHLRRGGQAIVTASAGDGRGEPVELFGRRRVLASAPARLARAAGVPMAGLSAAWIGDHLDVQAGPEIAPGRPEAMRELADFFELRVRRHPDAWSGLLRHLERAPARR